jgi:hypothetical protein
VTGIPGLRGRAARADREEVTPFSWAGRLPAVLIRVAGSGPSDGQSFDAARDGDVLAWLGFEPTGEQDAPLLPWGQPERWPTGRRAVAGRHRAPARLQPA